MQDATPEVVSVGPGALGEDAPSGRRGVEDTPAKVSEAAPKLRARQVRLARRPEGPAHSRDFELAHVVLPEPRDGEVLVENRFLSVDPYMRARMDDRLSYYSPWKLHAPLHGDAVGVVVESRTSRFKPGDWVAGEHGLRDRFVSPAADLRALRDPPSGFDHSVYLGALGAPGLTAYVGVTEILRPEPGETVFVTTAAGAVGSAAGQICRALEARVIGSTGSAEKVERVISRYRFDAGFDYHVTSTAAALHEHAPDGIDGMFDSVGGKQLEDALDWMNVGGRIAKCGAITGYDTGVPVPGPGNLEHFFGKRLTMKGFLVSDHHDLRPVFEAQMREWLSDGQVVADETRFHGIEQVVEAFLDLFQGRNIGKTVIGLDHGG
jgi:NADPH-dependent curcumin reductase CurA